MDPNMLPAVSMSMITYDYMNTMRAVRTNEYLGQSGCYGARAETYEAALSHALDQAAKTRAIHKFPMVIETVLTIRQEG